LRKLRFDGTFLTVKINDKYITFSNDSVTLREEEFQRLRPLPESLKLDIPRVVPTTEPKETRVKMKKKRKQKKPRLPRKRTKKKAKVGRKRERRRREL